MQVTPEDQAVTPLQYSPASPMESEQLHNDGVIAQGILDAPVNLLVDPANKPEFMDGSDRHASGSKHMPKFME